MKKFKILIAENLPSYNKGEMAILYGLTDNTKNLNIEYSMYSFHPDFDKKRYGNDINIIDIRNSWSFIKKKEDGLNIFKSFRLLFSHILFAISYKVIGSNILKIWKGEIWENYLNSDLIIYGHDSSFGIGGDPENPLLYPLYISSILKLMKKKTMFFAGTIPNLPKRFPFIFKKLFLNAIKNTTVCSFREKKSYNFLIDSGYKKNNIHMAADIAYLLNYNESFFKTISKKYKLDEKKFISVTLSQVRANISYPYLDINDSYIKHITLISKLCKKLSKNFKILFLPHSVGINQKSKNYDLRIYNDIIKMNKSNDNFIILNEELEPKELKSVISKSKLLIGERLHSVIAGSSSNVPSIALSFKKDVRLNMVSPVITKKNVFYIEELKIDLIFNRIKSIFKNYNSEKRNLKKNYKQISLSSYKSIKLLKNILGI